MTFIIIAAVIVFIFLLSITIILLIAGPIILLQPKKRTAEFYRQLGLPTTPSEIGLNYEEINIITDDGIKLNSWLIKSDIHAVGTILYLHGVADCKIDGIRFSKLMHDHGFNVFLFDARRHGNSEGKFCTYGYYEKYDVVKVIDYLTSRTDVHLGKIGIFGTSMGAAVAIQASSIDKRIAAIVAENSFAALRTIFDDYQKRIVKLPFHYLRNIVIVRSELMANFKASTVSPIESIQNILNPILIIYGTNDRLIKHQYSLMLFEKANEPKDIFPIEGASHNDIWRIAGDVYERKLLDFYQRNLK